MFEIAFHIVVTLVAFVAMEGFAWMMHRHVMHGWGWEWHRSHHEPRTGLLERNDLFAIVFAAPAIGLFWLGSLPGLGWVWYAALGVSLYGLVYAFVHDGLVHQRWGLRWVPQRGYLRRLIVAHRLHHAVQTRHDAVSFGFLYAPDPKRLKARLKAYKERRG